MNQKVGNPGSCQAYEIFDPLLFNFFKRKKSLFIINKCRKTYSKLCLDKLTYEYRDANEPPHW